MSTSNDLDGRLAGLERQNRRLWLALVGLGVLQAAVHLPAAAAGAVPPAVQAQRFELADASGRVRGVWTLDTDGLPRFTLYDLDGREIVALSKGMKTFEAIVP